VKRKASAEWQGGLKDGKGTVSTDSGVLSNVSYSFAKRFGEEKGTNPEELIAAAHSSCFAMATSAQLDGAGIKAQNIAATATVTLEKVGEGFAVTSSHLDVTERTARRCKQQRRMRRPAARFQSCSMRTSQWRRRSKFKLTTKTRNKESRHQIIWCRLSLCLHVFVVSQRIPSGLLPTSPGHA